MKGGTPQQVEKHLRLATLFWFKRQSEHASPRHSIGQACKEMTFSRSNGSPPRRLMNSRRRIATPEARTSHRTGKIEWPGGVIDVRFGSQADVCSALADVRLVPKADSCSAAKSYSITSSARASSVGGTVMPSALAVFRLMYSSALVAYWTGRSAGFSPLMLFGFRSHCASKSRY